MLAPSFTVALLRSGLTLRNDDYAGKETPILVQRNFTIQGIGQDAVALDLNFLKAKVAMASGVYLTLRNIAILNWRIPNGSVLAGGIDWITAAPQMDTTTDTAVAGTVLPVLWFDNCYWFNPRAFAPPIARQAMGSQPRPAELPGPQLVTIPVPPPTDPARCSNDSDAPPLTRCVAYSGKLIDVAWAPVRILPGQDTRISLGYLVKMTNVTTMTIEAYPDDCVQRLGPLGCTVWYNANQTSVPVITAGTGSPPPADGDSTTGAEGPAGDGTGGGAAGPDGPGGGGTLGGGQPPGVPAGASGVGVGAHDGGGGVSKLVPLLVGLLGGTAVLAAVAVFISINLRRRGRKKACGRLQDVATCEGAVEAAGAESQMPKAALTATTTIATGMGTTTPRTKNAMGNAHPSAIAKTASAGETATAVARVTAGVANMQGQPHDSAPLDLLIQQEAAGELLWQWGQQQQQLKLKLTMATAGGSGGTEGPGGESTITCSSSVPLVTPQTPLRTDITLDVQITKAGKMCTSSASRDLKTDSDPRARPRNAQPGSGIAGGSSGTTPGHPVPAEAPADAAASPEANSAADRDAESELAPGNDGNAGQGYQDNSQLVTLLPVFLGRGGFGSVYQGVYRGVKVAVKVLEAEGLRLVLARQPPSGGVGGSDNAGGGDEARSGTRHLGDASAAASGQPEIGEQQQSVAGSILQPGGQPRWFGDKAGLQQQGLQRQADVMGRVVRVGDPDASVPARSHSLESSSTNRADTNLASGGGGVLGGPGATSDFSKPLSSSAASQGMLLAALARRQAGVGTLGRAEEALEAARRERLGARAAKQADMLAQEVEILGRCTHPNVVRLLAACLTPPRYCLVLELMETSLQTLIYGSPGALVPLPKVLHIAEQICMGLEYLHPTIVHRDLKPANVLVSGAHSDRPVAKLADFGLSRIRLETQPTAHAQAGTPSYLAPECLDVTNQLVTHRADMYALGTLLWAMVTSRRPWENLNMMQVATKVAQGERPSLDDVPEERCPVGLRDLMRWCWEADPQRRPAATEALREIRLLQSPPPAMPRSGSVNVALSRALLAADGAA